MDDEADSLAASTSSGVLWAVVGTIVAMMLATYIIMIQKKKQKRKEWFLASQLDGKKKEDALSHAIEHKRSAKKHLKEQKARKREKVFLAAPDLNVSYNDQKYPKSQEEKDLIMIAIRDNLLFSHLEQADINALIEFMEPRSVNSGNVAIKEGEHGEYFFVLGNGEIEMVTDGKVTEVMTKGDSYGELALLYDRPQAFTVRAKTDASGWRLHRDTYRNVIAQKHDKSSSDAQKMLRSVNILQGLSDEQMNRLAEVAVDVEYKEGQTILKKGDPGTICFGIMSGTVRVTDFGGDVDDVILGPGGYFGERALITKEPRAATVIANSDVTLIALSTKDTEPVLGNMKEMFIQNHHLRTLAAVPMFSDFTHEMLASLVAEAKRKSFKKGEHIVRKGEVGTSLFVISKGECEVVITDEDGNRSVVKKLGSLNFFGEMALIRHDVRRADVIAAEDCHVIEIQESSFSRMFGASETFSRKLIAMAASRDKSLKHMENPPEKISMDQLETVTVLGQGAFGRVSLMRHKSSGLCYALKAMSIQFIEEHKQANNIVGEKKAMELCDHPFILKLRNTYKDNLRVYFLLDYCNGGELYKLIHDPKKETHGVSDSDAKFYGACELLALEHLSLHSMAYRDMKPENTLIDSDGYCKMIDMGFAKIVKGKTYTFCGTPEYLAPEVILGTGHNRAVDYWSYGVLIFEMICGQTPFVAHTNDGIFRNIARGRIRYPSKMTESAKSLLQELLEANPTKRLGMLTGGVMGIMNHEWFSDIEFSKLIKKKVEAPWKPESKDDSDSSNFQDMEEEDDALDGEYISRESWLKIF